MSYVPFDNVQIVGEVDIKEEKHQFDAYGRMRTSSVTTLFESQLTKTPQNRLWHTVVDGTGSTTYLENQSSMNLNVLNPGDIVIRQSKIYTTARLGKSHLVYLSGNIANDTGITKRLGYFDLENGVFYETDGNVLTLVVRSKASGVVLEDRIPQTSWNVDRMDGTGENGITLDIANDQVFIFDIEWMGTGKVRAGLLLDGEINYVHEFKYSNTDNKPYMRTATLPARFEIENISGVANTEFSSKQTAAVIMTEGGPNEFANGFVISNEIAPKQISNALTPIMSIRPKFTNLQGGINRISSMLDTAEIYSEDDDLYFELKIDTVLTNDFFNDVDDESSVEFDYSSDTCSGGTVIAKGYTKKDGTVKTIDKRTLVKHLLTVGYDGSSSTTLTLLAKSLNTVTADVFTTFSWAEDD